MAQMKLKILLTISIVWSDLLNVSICKLWTPETAAKHVSDLKAIVEKCGLIAKMYNLTTECGRETTKDGNVLSVVVLGENKDRHKYGIPEIRLVSNIHGNEPIGMETNYVLLQVFCSSYNRYYRNQSLSSEDSEIVRLLQTTRIHILFLANPDGYDFYMKQFTAQNLSNIYFDGRNNSNDVDLNRNFPLNINKLAHDQNVTSEDIRQVAKQRSLQIETQMLMKWMHSQLFVLGLNYHGGAMVITYPYDAQRADGQPGYSTTAIDNLLESLAYKFLRAHSIRFNRCSESFGDGVVNGAAWYSFDGSMPDYSYLNTQCLELTIEGSCTKHPEQRYSFLISAYIVSLRTYKYLQAAHWGIKGRVTFDGNANIVAKIKVIHLNGTSSFINRRITKSSESGEYYRLLTNGNYAIVVKKGRCTVIHCLQVQNDDVQAQVVDFDLPKRCNGQQRFKECEDADKAVIKRLLVA